MEELKTGYCKQMGVWLSESEIEEIFNKADTNGDGALDWNEFL